MNKQFVVKLYAPGEERSLGEFDTRKEAQHAAVEAGAMFEAGTFSAEEDLFPVDGHEDDENFTIAVEKQSVAIDHPTVDLIKRMLMRRGDSETVALGRALAITEALVDTRMLRTDGDFLPFDHDRGIIRLRP